MLEALYPVVFVDALRVKAVFPQTTLETCIVPLLRQSLDFANGKQRKPHAVALRTIYAASAGNGARFPTIVAAWRVGRGRASFPCSPSRRRFAA